jgi:hypothetical protein
MRPLCRRRDRDRPDLDDHRRDHRHRDRPRRDLRPGHHDQRLDRRDEPGRTRHAHRRDHQDRRGHQGRTGARLPDRRDHLAHARRNRRVPGEAASCRATAGWDLSRRGAAACRHPDEAHQPGQWPASAHLAPHRDPRQAEALSVLVT